MEDEDIAPNMYSYIQLVQSVWGKQVTPVHCIPGYCTGTTFCPYRPWISCTLCIYLNYIPRLQFCGLIYIQLLHLYALVELICDQFLHSSFLCIVPMYYVFHVENVKIIKRYLCLPLPDVF